MIELLEEELQLFFSSAGNSGGIISGSGAFSAAIIAYAF